MELKEINNLRKQIREILLNTDSLKDIKGLKKKLEVPELRKICYDKLVDLKNEFEAGDKSSSKEDLIKKIEDLNASLGQIKKLLGNQLD